MRQGASAHSLTFMTFIYLMCLLDEIIMREAFRDEHGGNLPDDLCSCIGNIPTQYEIRPVDDTEGDELPVIDEDVLAEVCRCVLLPWHN